MMSEGQKGFEKQVQKDVKELQEEGRLIRESSNFDGRWGVVR